MDALQLALFDEVELGSTHDEPDTFEAFVARHCVGCRMAFRSGMMRFRCDIQERKFIACIAGEEVADVILARIGDGDRCAEWVAE